MASRYRAVLLFTTLLVMMAACGDKKKSEKKDKEENRPTPAAVEGLQAVPASATAVIGIDVRKLSSSPIILRALERMFARDKTLEGDLRAVLDACKFDPKTDLSSATIALLPAGEESDSLLVAKGKFSESVITACLGRFLSETGGRLEAADLDGRALYHQVSAEGPGIWLAFGSEDTLLIASARGALETALSEGPKIVAAGQGVARLLSRAKTEATVWGIAHIDGAVGQGLVAATGGQVAPPSSVVAFAELGQGLSMAVEVEMSSPDDAKTLISQASTQLQAAALVLQIDAVGRLVRKIEVSSAENWARLGWRLDEQELADLMGGNFSGLSSTIDNEESNDENPAPESGQEGESQNGKQHPDAGNEEDPREQGQAHQ